MSEKQSKLKVFWSRYGGTGFIISVLIHGVLFLAAGIWVVNEYVLNPRKAAEAPPPKEQSKQIKQVEFTIQTARQKSMASSTPMNVQRIAIAGSGGLQLPETPDLPGAGAFGNSFNIGQGGPGLGGFGGGGGGGSGPMVKIPAFGFQDMQRGAFRGELYDLKQTPAGKLIEPRTNYPREVRTFFESGWNRSALRKFYRAPTPLYAVQFYVPWMNADEAPKAFKAEQQIAPNMWLAVYEAKVSPPSSGRYRFVGAADDLVAVRFNKKLVLEAYWGGTILPDYKPSGYVRYPSVQGDNKIPGFPNGFVAGEWISLDANQAYEMQVVLGERPGGQFWAYLFVEKEGETYKKNAKGDPELPIFRVRRGITEETKSKDSKSWSAPFVKESPVWKVY